MNDDILNCKEALALLSNKQYLYRRLLERFLISESQGIYDITLLLNQGKLEEAARSTHSIKGLSLNLGAAALHQISTHLDTVFKSVSEIDAAPEKTSKNILTDEAAKLDQYNKISAETLSVIKAWLAQNPI